MASKLVIHNGSTTAVEALLLDKTVISYRPFKNNNIETELPHAISCCLDTEDDVVNYVCQYKENKNTKSRQARYFK